MKKIITLFFLLLQTTGSSFAAEPVPADAEVCAAILSKAAGNILSRYSLSGGKTVRLSFSHGIPLSPMANDALEALVTSRGFTITGSPNKADIILDTAVTDISIILQEHNNLFNRTVRLTVHIKCLDSSRTVFFASGSSETAQDTIPKKYLRSTNNGHLFCKVVSRTIIAQDRKNIMVATLLIITGLLVYFAFHQ
ncbi:hypothetical protein ES707_21043 [subsurface metagenome]